jgi:hypothetical protein
VTSPSSSPSVPPTLPPSFHHLTVNNHTALSDFYTKSYHIVRKYSHTALVIFNELYPRVSTAHSCLILRVRLIVIIVLHIILFDFKPILSYFFSPFCILYPTSPSYLSFSLPSSLPSPLLLLPLFPSILFTYLFPHITSSHPSSPYLCLPIPLPNSFLSLSNTPLGTKS